MKILLIDDEAQIRSLLDISLSSSDRKILLANTGQEGLERIIPDQPDQPDVVLLDLGLPDQDGLSVLTQIRRASSIPVIVLTVRDDEEAKVTALDLGADDYLTKPFSIAELTARIRAVTRRAQVASSSQESSFERGRLRVNFVLHTVEVAGNAIHLTKTEFALLELFIRHPGRVLTHKQILEKVWTGQAGVQVHYLRVYLNNLRKKIERDPSRPEFILTEPGIGYRFVAE